MSSLLSFTNLGFTVTLRVDDPALADLARDFHSAACIGIADCPSATPADLVWQAAPTGGWQILLHGNRWGEPMMQAEHLFLHSDGLLDDLIRERCGDVPLLHAGAVASRDGRGVIFCGPSGAGKTSLVLACVLREWSWLTDEWLCFRSVQLNRAEGFCRNFNLKERSFAAFPELAQASGVREFTLPNAGHRVRYLNPRQLDGGAHLASANMRLIVFPLYVPDARETEVERVTGVSLVNRIAPELRSSGARMFAWLGNFTQQVPAYLLRYRNAHEAPGVLEKLLNAP